MISIVLFVQVVASFRPTTAYAQFVDVNQGVRNLTDNFGDAILAAALGALVSGASYFMRKMAYDTAKYAASGFKGQKPLAETQNFGDYLKDTAGAVAGAAIDELGKEFGVNLCAPPVDIKIGLLVKLDQVYSEEKAQGLEPDCTFDEFANNIKSFRDNLDSQFSDQTLLEEFNTAIHTSQGGQLGLAINAFKNISAEVNEKTAAAQLQRLEGNGFRAVTDLISGDIRTPAQTVQEEAKTLTGGYQTKLNSEQIAGLYGSGAVSILPSALSIFANTLLSTLLQDVLEKGLLPRQNDPSSAGNYFASTLNSNRQSAEQVFSYLITANKLPPLTEYNIITEFSTCNNNPGLNNCVMDNGFVQALTRARTGETPVTIAEALTQNLLHPNWPLIPPSRAVDNTNIQYCHGSAYCYSNVQKLRKALIIPLGFEIAVAKSDPDHPWTLGNVVKGFNDCDASGNPSSAHPYCKLIDPNWILKAPEARCEALVYGPELTSPSLGTRRQECADFSTCLAVDGQGQCIGFGYCTQQKNVWNMPGQSCAPEYNTCKTYKGDDGSLGSYLSRTIDLDVCKIDSVGCRAYSVDKVGDTWKQTTAVNIDLAFSGRTQAIHFNDTRAQCPASAEGCSLFIDPANSVNINLKKAPEYLGCYDTNLNTPETIDWPKSEADLAQLRERPGTCSSFATACIPDEVGCDLYQPKNGGTAVTGVVGGNSCPATCVGYETFKQEATVFEKEKFPVNFISRAARTCSVQQVGCDEFTNIGAAASGGESLEYYSNLKQCVLPNGTNGKIFYSWEGSEREGFILKRHTLLQLTALDAGIIGGLGLTYQGDDTGANVFSVGSPAYVDDAEASLQANYTQCNQTSYNLLINNPYNPNAAHPDCRAFYDTSGNIYYRILRNTVTVSTECTPLRKTNSELFIDQNVTALGDVACTQKGGLWQNNSCSRCVNGGRYEASATGGGSCVYNSVKAEATSCSAQANGCRSYIGNTGNNIYQVANFGFEPVGTSADALSQAIIGWSGTDRFAPNGGVSIQAEATQVGLHSLRVDSTLVGYSFAAETIQPGAWYELRFWARGNASQSLAVTFNQGNNPVGNAFTFDPLTNSNVYAPVEIEWQEYRLGPVQFTGTTGAVNLVFVKNSGPANSFYFLDNVELVQIGGASNAHIFLIKNSWKTAEGYEVPTACDANPTDGLPGQYLGCREYTKRDGAPVTVTGFDHLCRVEAVGCRALVDTQNTTAGEHAGEKQASGVICMKPSIDFDKPVKCSVMLKETSEFTPTYSCTVEKGKQKCRIKEPVVLGSALTLSTNPDNCISDGTSCTGNTDKLFIDDSTIVTRADSDTIYLAQRTEFSCNEAQRGCMRVGFESQSFAGNAPSAYSYQDAFVISNPEKYTETLCASDQVGCEKFTQNNAVTYFKDPKITGGSLCVYKNQVTLGTGSNEKTYNGWFLDGVGTCSGGSQNGQLCKTKEDCGTGANVSCQNVGTTACYSNYIDENNAYGVWSAGSDGYQGKVATCDIASNGCTELVDRADVSPATPKGKSYYVIMNEQLTKNIGQCQGKVSQKEGCVLFDQTENANKIWNTDASYTASENATPKDSAVLPSTAGTLDSNLILKVTRDRSCSEWLACRTSVTIFDQNGKPQSLCQEYAACNKLSSTGQCLEWANTSLDNTRLTEAKYITRPTGWIAPEYTGYSLFGAYNPSDYVYLLFPNHDEAFLAYEMSPAIFATDRSFTEKSCNVSTGKLDGALCGFDDGGRCYRNRCLYPINGTFNFVPTGNLTNDTKSILEKLQPGICKSYPESDSPFSIDVALNSTPANSQTRVEYTDKKEKYERANVCQPGSSSKDCSCEYIKVEYKNGTKDYWPVGSEQLVAAVPGICVGGEKDGNTCSTVDDCGGVFSGSTCSPMKQQGTFYGQRGLCLEYDLSRPLGVAKSTARLHEAFACLTWLPIQVSASAVDLYNADLEAGYNPVVDAASASGAGGYSYCTESTNRGVGYFSSTLARPLDGKLGAFADSKLSNTTGVNNLFLYNTYDIHGDPAERKFSTIFNTALNSYQVTPPTGGIYEALMKDKDSELAPLNGLEESVLYRVMQSWAWRNVGQSARILRLDTRGGEHTDREPNYITKTSGQSNKFEVYSFAPAIPFALGSDQRAEDTGVLMHPPRFLGTQPSVGDYYIHTGSQELDIAETSVLSPEIGNSSNFQSNGFIRADGIVESALREEDLRSIYFVPLAFPDGAEGTNPALLSKGMRINFDYLRNTAPVFREEIPAYHDGEDDQHFAELTDTDTQMYNVMYVLNRSSDSLDCDANGLLSNCEYENVNPEGNMWGWYNSLITLGGNTELKEQNRIQKRYVALIFKKKTENYDSQFGALEEGTNASLPTNQIDPFSPSFVCEWKKDNNWLAIGLDFNKDGEFLGYISRWCMGDQNENGENNGIRFATIADFNDRCVEYTAVVDDTVDPLNDGTNKAWTDRVWGNSVWRSAPINPFLVNVKDDTTDGINPYGSLSADIKASYLRNPPNEGIRKYSFPNYTQGIPYKCTGGEGFGANNSNSIFESSVGCRIPGVQLSQAVSQNTTAGTQILRDLFMKYYVVEREQPGTASTNDFDESEKPSGTLPPRIFSINPYACTQAGGTCTPGEADNLTLNLRNYTLADYNNDTIADEDKDGDGAIDPIIADGIFSATVNFFAYADDNRMPIKRVTVKWGDEAGVNLGKDGLYKNRKPYCGESDAFTYTHDSTSNTGLGRCANTQITCNTNDDCKFIGANSTTCVKPSQTRYFGDAPRACKDEYFEFSHTYSCTPAEAEVKGKKVSTYQISDPEAYRRLIAREGITGDTKVCEFRPAVQVVDNWGWCNASQINSSDAFCPNLGQTNGCYGPLGGFLDRCEGSDNSYTQYKGKVIIVP